MKNVAAISVVILLCIGMFFAGRKSASSVVKEILTTDTITVVDTIRDTIPQYRRVTINRIDTVFLNIPGDTVKVQVEVPIERKEYSTDAYRAIIEGYRAKLLSMEVYQKTNTIIKPEIRTITKKTRWGVGVSAGYGVSENGLSPFVGLGISYNLITW